MQPRWRVTDGQEHTRDERQRQHRAERDRERSRSWGPPERVSKASQPSTRSTARYANRSDTGTDSARSRGLAQPNAELGLHWSDTRHQVSGRDKIVGTHTLTSQIGWLLVAVVDPSSPWLMAR